MYTKFSKAAAFCSSSSQHFSVLLLGRIQHFKVQIFSSDLIVQSEKIQEIFEMWRARRWRLSSNWKVHIILTWRNVDDNISGRRGNSKTETHVKNDILQALFPLSSRSYHYITTHEKSVKLVRRQLHTRASAQISRRGRIFINEREYVCARLLHTITKVFSLIGDDLFYSV